MNEESLVLQQLKEGNRDLEWLCKNYSDVQKEYSNKFVAIKDGGIFLASSKLEELLKHIKKQKKETGDYLIDFIFDKDESLVV